MSLTINVNGLTLCHKGSKGVSRNTLPDICKTPGLGIPIPYPNQASSSDLTKGTSSVFADGGNMIANYGSRFARSIFDEAGTMGGIISNTNRAEADWITHSFDVFFEKKPACRLTDKMFMNHHNTVNMSGLNQASLAPDSNPDSELDVRKDIVEPICDPIGLSGGENTYVDVSNPLGLAKCPLREILADVDKWSLVKISDRQKGMIRDKHSTVKERSTALKNKMRKFFEKNEKKIIKEWEKQTGIDWPILSNGKRATLHHVIPLKNGGSNDWWNIVPVQNPHTGTIHGTGSALRTYVPYQKGGGRLLYLLDPIGDLL